MKPPLTKRPSEVGYWELNKMPRSSECLRQKHQVLNFWTKTIWGNYCKQAKLKWERRVSNRWNHIRKKGLLLIVESDELWTLKPKLWIKSNLGFDKELCYCTCLLEMFKVNYLREKYNKHSATLLMPSIVFLHSPLRFLTVA